jgi:transposase
VDLGVFHSRHPNDGAGRAAYDPDMMVALLIYGYCCGERSSRKI